MCRELVLGLGREHMNFDSFVSSAHGGAGWRDSLSGNPPCKSPEEERLMSAVLGRICRSPILGPASFPFGVGKLRILFSQGHLPMFSFPPAMLTGVCSPGTCFHL